MKTETEKRKAYPDFYRFYDLLTDFQKLINLYIECIGDDAIIKEMKEAYDVYKFSDIKDETFRTEKDYDDYVDACEREYFDLPSYSHYHYLTTLIEKYIEVFNLKETKETVLYYITETEKHTEVPEDSVELYDCVINLRRKHSLNYMVNIKEIGERIAIFRTKYLKISRQAFADKCGYTPTQALRMERGERDFLISTLCKITEAFNVSPNWILFGVGNVFLNEGGKYDNKKH